MTPESARPPAGRHRVLTRPAVARLALGWLAVPALAAAVAALPGSVPTALLLALLGGVVAVIVACSFGVVEQAERLAHRLGDPYGSLVLTLSIVLIEVVLVSAVMLGPGDHATIARDSVTAVSMIILDLVVGLSLLLGGLRFGALTPNRAGAARYLAMLLALGTLAFALPPVIGTGGAYTTAQALTVAVATVVLYAVFLARQTGARAADFQEVHPVGPAPAAMPTPATPAARSTWRSHRRELVARTALLVGTVLPIVLLSHDMAAMLDDAVARAGAPAALAGLVIASIVFLPESLTSLRAALAGEVQRVSNLCHGALVSTVGLTVPSVLVIGAATGQRVMLAETPANLALLALSLALTAVTFLAPRAGAVHGAAHLTLFGAYVLALLA